MVSVSTVSIFLILFHKNTALNLFDYTRSIQKVSSHVIWNVETFTEEDTKYKTHCMEDNDASVPFKVGTLGPHTVRPNSISCPVIFSWISLMVWYLFPFKGDFSFGKSQKSQGTKSGLKGGWVTWVIWCFAKSSAWDVMHERTHCWWWSCQSPVAIAAAFWIIWIVSQRNVQA